LLEFYRNLLVDLSGAAGEAERLPGAIAAVAMKPASNQVAIGNQRAAIVTAALAFDAGFTVAYRKGERHSAGMPDLQTLKPIAERCLSQSEADLALCFSTGYVYGARSVSGLPMTSIGNQNEKGH